MKKLYRRMPAEWEQQSCVQLTWPHKDTDWAPMLPEITAVYEAMAREILKREDLLIVAPEGMLVNVNFVDFCHDSAKQASLMALATPKVQRSMFNVQCPTNDTWARDHGFITVEQTSAISHQPSSSSTSVSTAGARNSLPTSTTRSIAIFTTKAS